MPKPKPKPLPELTPDRLLERLAEALQVGLEPEKIRDYPVWTRRVMRILREQFIPDEFASMLTAEHAVFAEGIVVTLATKARDLARNKGLNTGLLARKLAERLGMDAASQAVAVQVESGALCDSVEFQGHVLRRLFAKDVGEQRAFIEGMAVGARLPELFGDRAERNTTDATDIYLMLWLYWPEISKLNSIGEVARALEPLFAANKNTTGVHWDERIRKLANRLGLSFQARQKRRRQLGGG